MQAAEGRAQRAEAEPGPETNDTAGLTRRRPPRAVFSRVRRWLRPPRRLRPTRAGWIFFALTLGVGFAALNTGNNLLYLVLSLMLAFLVLSGVLSEAALRGISVRRRLPPEFVAESDAWVALEIRNRQSRVAAYAVAVEDRMLIAGVERPAGRCFALRIDSHGNAERSYRFRPEHRGALQFMGFVVSTRFPFGLFSKSLIQEAEESALVYPALDRLEVLPRHFEGEETGEQTSGPSGHGTSVGGIREYETGDPPRRIDWRSSLRAGELWVREPETEESGEFWVRLRTAGRRVGEDFERDVRRSASEVAAWLEAGLRVGLQTDLERVAPASGTRQRQRLLGLLARVQAVEGT